MVPPIHHVRNDDVRWKTEQPCLSATVQAWHLSLFGHIARMPDESDAKQILTACPWKTGGDHRHLESLNPSLNKAIDMAQNSPVWRMMSAFDGMHS